MRSGDKMKIRKFDEVCCEYDRRGDVWECVLEKGNVKRFKDITLGRPKETRLFGNGSAEAEIEDVYCSMAAEEMDLYLFCDADKEELERRLGRMEYEGFE